MGSISDEQLTAELELVDVRARTRALIEDTQPVLHDLQQALDLARDVLGRLDQEAGQ